MGAERSYHRVKRSSRADESSLDRIQAEREDIVDLCGAKRQRWIGPLHIGEFEDVIAIVQVRGAREGVELCINTRAAIQVVGLLDVINADSDTVILGSRNIGAFGIQAVAIVFADTFGSAAAAAAFAADNEKREDREQRDRSERIVPERVAD